MGVRLIVGVGESETDKCAMYDSVTGWAFGPVFESEGDAIEFLGFLDVDARSLAAPVLEERYDRWVATREEA